MERLFLGTIQSLSRQTLSVYTDPVAPAEALAESRESLLIRGECGGSGRSTRREFLLFFPTKFRYIPGNLRDAFWENSGNIVL